MSLVKAIQELVSKASAAVDWAEFAKSFPRIRCIIEDHIEDRTITVYRVDAKVELVAVCKRCRCVYDPADYDKEE